MCVITVIGREYPILRMMFSYVFRMLEEEKNLIISQSFIASEGYYIHQADVTVYSIEELAYLCMYKGYVLDRDFACKELVQWIFEKCGCENLAYKLDMILKENAGQQAFVETLLRFVGYVSEKEISRIMKEISQGLNLSGFERKKQQADLLYEQKRYMQAVSAYEAILEVVPEVEVHLRADCYRNLAAAKAQMFLYEQALDALEMSYRILPKEDTLFAWLSAARLYYTEAQYLDIISQREDLYEISLRLEEKIKEIKENMTVSKEGQELEKLREWLQYGGEDGYYIASGRVLKVLCDEYKETFGL